MLWLRKKPAQMARQLGEYPVTVHFRTTARIARNIAPFIERLSADTRSGEVCRCFIAHWNRFKYPPIDYYLGTSSVCQIFGPTVENRLPAGAQVISPGAVTTLSPSEADDLHIKITEAIEIAIVTWLDSNGYDQYAPHKFQGETDRG